MEEDIVNDQGNYIDQPLIFQSVSFLYQGLAPTYEDAHNGDTQAEPSSEGCVLLVYLESLPKYTKKNSEDNAIDSV